jgi:hypothetical protein
MREKNQNSDLYMADIPNGIYMYEMKSTRQELERRPSCTRPYKRLLSHPYLYTLYVTLKQLADNRLQEWLFGYIKKLSDFLGCKFNQFLSPCDALIEFQKIFTLRVAKHKPGEQLASENISTVWRHGLLSEQTNKLFTDV